MTQNKILISAGGTGGHIIPARAFAKYISKKGHEVVFFGDANYASYIKPEDNFKSKIISASKFDKSAVGLLKSVIKISIGVLQSMIFIIRFKPKFVVAFGGYATFPVLVAAVLTKTKIIIHEQNSHLGKVNRIFAKYANKIATSFPKTSGFNGDLKKIFFTGNPVRQDVAKLHELEYSAPQIVDLEPPVFNTQNKMGYNVILASDFHDAEIQSQKTPELFSILVLGGSGGAKIFSEILPKAFFNLSERIKMNIHITQQCRKELVKSTFDQYKSYNVNILIDSFFENMPEVIKSSHLVIARSGSSSIFEFCAAKKPMILIPFAAAADNHQEKNARYLEEHGAAIVITESEFTINKINEVIKNLIENRFLLNQMSQNAASLAVLNATENLSKLVS